MVCQKDFCVKILFVSTIVFMSLISCATYDISQDPILRGNYDPGEILVSKIDILLQKNNYLWFRKIDIERVKEHGLRGEYKGIIAKGTELKIVKIELYRHIENGNYIYPMAVVLNGPWKGEEVNLHYTSKSSDSPYNDTYYIDILDVDPDLFEIVKN